MNKFLAIALPIIGIIVVAVFAEKTLSVVPYKPDMITEAGKVAAALFAVAVFLERSLAVINSLLFGEQKRQQEAALATSLDGSALSAHAQTEASEERVRLAVGFLFALLVSAAGVRTLAGLLDAKNLTGSALHFFQAVDVVLTAGLLAGGSNGLAQIIGLLKTQVQAKIAEARQQFVAAQRAVPLSMVRAGTRTRDSRGQVQQRVLPYFHARWPNANEASKLTDDLSLAPQQILDVGTQLAEELRSNPARSEILACRTVGDLIDLLYEAQ